MKNNGRKCEIGHVGIPGRNFFAGLRFSHQLLLSSGHTFHNTPFLSFSVWIIFLVLILTFVFAETLWYHNSNGLRLLWIKVLIYGRERSVILEAVAHDNHCVLANILAAHFLYSPDYSRALTCLHAAQSHLVPFHLLLLFSSLSLFPPKAKPLWCVFVILLLQDQATLYEKLVFDTISYLLSEDRDDDVALQLHSNVSDSVGPFDLYASLISFGTNLM